MRVEPRGSFKARVHGSVPERRHERLLRARDQRNEPSVRGKRILRRRFFNRGRKAPGADDRGVPGSKRSGRRGRRHGRGPDRSALDHRRLPRQRNSRDRLGRERLLPCCLRLLRCGCEPYCRVLRGGPPEGDKGRGVGLLPEHHRHWEADGRQRKVPGRCLVLPIEVRPGKQHHHSH